MQNIDIEFHFNDVEIWNKWFSLEFINKLSYIFDTDNINLINTHYTRWEIIRKYKLFVLSYSCEIDLHEIYHPSYNINNSDFVLILIHFYFTKIDGTITTIETDIYTKIN